MAAAAGRLALTIFNSLKTAMKGPGRFKRTMGMAGKGARYGAAAGIGGAIGLGVNPWLGLGAANLIKGGGGGGAGAGASGGGAGAAGDAAASRDSSIIAGMLPHTEFKAPTIPRLKPNADFRTMLEFTTKVTHATLETALQNNKELIYIQKMLQGPTASRAKELRMESQRQAITPVIININN